MTVQKNDGAPSICSIRSTAVHGVEQKARHTHAGCSGAHQDKSLVLQVGVCGPAVREDARKGDCSRALDVVVERRQLVAVPVEKGERVRLLEILPLQQCVRPASLHSSDEFIDKLVIGLASQSRVSPSDVELVAEQSLVVGADIETDRERVGRMDPRGEGVQRELADGYHHASRPLVSQAEDALVVRDHDETHVVVPHMAEDLVDATAMLRRYPQPTPSSKDVAEADGGVAYRRRVHDRNQLGHVFGHDLIEQCLVAVLKRHHPHVLLQWVGALGSDVFVCTSNLKISCRRLMRQHPLQLEDLAFLRRERRPLVQKGIHENRLTPLPHIRDDPPPVLRALDLVLHCTSGSLQIEATPQADR